MLAGDMKMPLVVLTVTLAQAAPTPSPPVPRAIALNTFLLPGAMLPDRGPDGNTIILVAPSGLVAIDTGRHPWHSDGILAFARSRRLPIAAIVNTHWHLDHSSGNRRVKAAHPQAKLYTTRAVDRALAPGGFLVRNIEAARSRARDPDTPAVRREETELFLATMDAADALRPDMPVERSGAITIAGRGLSVRVAADSVTAADLWLYDETTGVAVLGDLVTLPAPFFETACPARWHDTLEEVWSTPCRLAVPGHGPTMSRAEFDTYRQAFGSFRGCVGSENAASVCAANWTKELGTLLISEGDRRDATEYASYYVDFLRKNGGTSPDCQAK
jgi:glyoxylase-like metal-dependent hydrolase (beta-lactamase superfamily II)